MTLPVRALVRRPSPAMADAELTHMARVPIDVARAEEQHAAYRSALAAAGVPIVCLPPLGGYPDCAFVEDVVLALAEGFVSLRPGAASRRGEVDSVLTALADGRPAFALAGEGTVDGGDVLVTGRDIFVGLSSRTNVDGAAALAAVVEPLGYRLQTVAVARSLHLKTAVTAVGETLVLNPAWVDAETFGNRPLILAPADEPFGANVLDLGDVAIVQSTAPGVAAKVSAAGYRVVSVDIGEFASVEAGLTCMSVLVPVRG